MCCFLWSRLSSPLGWLVWWPGSRDGRKISSRNSLLGKQVINCWDAIMILLWTVSVWVRQTIEEREAPLGLLKAALNYYWQNCHAQSFQSCTYRSEFSGELLLTISGASAGVTFETFPSIVDNVKWYLISEMSHCLMETSPWRDIACRLCEWGLS